MRPYQLLFSFLQPSPFLSFFLSFIPPLFWPLYGASRHSDVKRHPYLRKKKKEISVFLLTNFLWGQNFFLIFLAFFFLSSDPRVKLEWRVPLHARVLHPPAPQDHHATPGVRAAARQDLRGAAPTLPRRSARRAAGQRGVGLVLRRHPAL